MGAGRDDRAGREVVAMVFVRAVRPFPQLCRSASRGDPARAVLPSQLQPQGVNEGNCEVKTALAATLPSRLVTTRQAI